MRLTGAKVSFRSWKKNPDTNQFGYGGPEIGVFIRFGKEGLSPDWGGNGITGVIMDREGHLHNPTFDNFKFVRPIPYFDIKPSDKQE